MKLRLELCAGQSNYVTPNPRPCFKGPCVVKEQSSNIMCFNSDIGFLSKPMVW